MRRVLSAIAAVAIGVGAAAAQPADVFRDLGQAAPESAAVQARLETLKSQRDNGPLFVGRFSPTTIVTSAAGEQVRLNVRPDLTIVARTVAVETIDGKLAWRGTIETMRGLPPRHATLIVAGETVMGTVPAPDGRVFRLYPLSGGATAIVELDYASMPPEEPEIAVERRDPQPEDRRTDAEPDLAALMRALEASQDAYRRQQSPSEVAPRFGTSPDWFDALKHLPAALTAVTEARTIDVMVVYTQAAAAAVGDIDLLATLAITETNDSLVNSGAMARVRNAGTMAVTYNDSRPYVKMITHLTNPTDKFIDKVHQQRDALKADVVVMIVDNPEYCGVARTIRANAVHAFAIAHWKCATGYYTFGHEIGHLMGARHDVDTDNTTAPFSWGHAYRKAAGATGWRTIMGYNCANALCNTRIQYWSTPLKLYLGEVMGTAALEDNTRVWNRRAKAVAAFR